MVQIPYEKSYASKSIKVWGCIGWDGVGRLERYEGMMDSSKYTEILERSFGRTALKEFRDGDWIFMQDNSSSHTKNFTKKIFDHWNFKPMDWPPQSPDMNPIENVWSVIKMELWKRREEILTKDDCWKVTKEIWFNMGNDLLRRMYG